MIIFLLLFTMETYTSCFTNGIAEAELVCNHKWVLGQEVTE